MASVTDIASCRRIGTISRVAAAVRIAPEGAKLVLVLVLAAALLLVIGAHGLGITVAAAAVAVGAFFRDPDRVAPWGEGIVLSAADGKVTDIGTAAVPGSATGLSYQRVSVFMSPLNVHVNRAPVAGDVVETAHTPGEFRAAFSDAASEHNERNLIVFTDRAGRRCAMVQVAGYLARRIVCRVRPRDRVALGDRVGLIMFGSRVDHYLPLEYRVAVSIGQRVRAGQTVIGELER